jgi:hypothetical protein
MIGGFVMRALLICLTLAFSVAAWGADPATPSAAKKQPAADGVSDALLRKQLEDVYRAVRESLLGKDYNAFLQLVLPAREGPPPPAAAFDKVALNLLDDYPVLEQLTFVKVERSGDWAGYYTVNTVAEPKSVFIHGFKFKHTAEGWKMSGKVAVIKVPRAGSQFRVADEVALNPVFRLPGQKGYKD